jgi:riboflavin kinase/FMN adenylyltransferase
VELFHNIEEFNKEAKKRPVIITIGAFDGVHVAHRALIAGAVMRARELGITAAVLSFDPHPDTVVKPDRKMIYLTSLEDKATLIKEVGTDALIIQPFNDEFRTVTAEGFVDKLLSVMDVREIHVGEDFVFGYKAQGNVVRLREMGHNLGFQVKSLAPLEVGNQVVSSTLIRRLLVEGDVQQAGRFLARYHSLSGVVVHGDQRGRTIGFPTANTAIPVDFAIPGNGVYATMTKIENEEKTRPSVTNIGVRPTFDGKNRTIETFLLDFEGDLYDKVIRVEFVKKLRDERKFSGIQEIREQLARDVENARLALEENGLI